MMAVDFASYTSLRKASSRVLKPSMSKQKIGLKHIFSFIVCMMETAMKSKIGSRMRLGGGPTGSLIVKGDRVPLPIAIPITLST